MQPKPVMPELMKSIWSGSPSGQGPAFSLHCAIKHQVHWWRYINNTICFKTFFLGHHNITKAKTLVLDKTQLIPAELDPVKIATTVTAKEWRQLLFLVAGAKHLATQAIPFCATMESVLGMAYSAKEAQFCSKENWIRLMAPSYARCFVHVVLRYKEQGSTRALLPSNLWPSWPTWRLTLLSRH